MPKRDLWEKIVTSRTLAELSAEEERFFYRLLVVCDDHGLCDGDPGVLRARCFARMLDDVTEAAVRQWRDRLAQVGLLEVYAVDGDDYLRVKTWSTYQRRRDSKPKFPPPSQSINGDNAPQLAANGRSRDQRPVPRLPVKPAPDIPEAGGASPHDAANGHAGSAPSSSLESGHDQIPDVPAPLAGFHAVLVGTQGYAPSPAFFEQVTERYGSLDLRQEALKMQSWLADPAHNRRHRSATTKFILGWLEREAADGSSGARPRANGASAAPLTSSAAPVSFIYDEGQEHAP